MCSSVKLATGQNLPPVLKIVTRTDWACCVDIVAKLVTGCSIFSTVRLDYGFLLELHTLTQASYALLSDQIDVSAEMLQLKDTLDVMS